MTDAQLDTLLEYYETRANAIRLVREMRAEHAKHANGNGNGHRPRLSTIARGADAVLVGALAVDAARRQKRTPKPKQYAHPDIADLPDRLRRIVELGPLTPMEWRDHGFTRLGPYITHGYMKQGKGGRYYATAKARDLAAEG